MSTFLARCVVGLAAGLFLVTVLVGIMPAELPPIGPRPTVVPTATLLPAADVRVGEADITIDQVLSEGQPFTMTVAVRNIGDLPAERVRVVVNIVRAVEEQNILAVQAQAGPIAPRSVLEIPVLIPAVDPLIPGLYRYQVSVGLLNGALDRNLYNNLAPAGLLTLGPPLDVCTGPLELVLQATEHEGRVAMTVENHGPTTLYAVPVRLRLSSQPAQAEVFYLARVLPCGGQATLQKFRDPGLLEIEVNPTDLPNPLPEPDHRNNVALLRICRTPTLSGCQD